MLLIHLKSGCDILTSFTSIYSIPKYWPPQFFTYFINCDHIIVQIYPMYLLNSELLPAEEWTLLFLFPVIPCNVFHRCYVVMCTNPSKNWIIIPFHQNNSARRYKMSFFDRDILGTMGQSPDRFSLMVPVAKTFLFQNGKSL